MGTNSKDAANAPVRIRTAFRKTYSRRPFDDSDECFYVAEWADGSTTELLTVRREWLHLCRGFVGDTPDMDVIRDALRQQNLDHWASLDDAAEHHSSSTQTGREVA